MSFAGLLLCSTLDWLVHRSIRLSRLLSTQYDAAGLANRDRPRDAKDPEMLRKILFDRLRATLCKPAGNGWRPSTSLPRGCPYVVGGRNGAFDRNVVGLATGKSTLNRGGDLFHKSKLQLGFNSTIERDLFRMEHHMLLVDIAGQFHRNGANLLVTTGGVAIAADHADYVRSLLPPDLPKWGRCTFAQAKEIGRIVARECLAVGAITRDLGTPAWQRFWEESAAHELMLNRLQGGKAGLLKPANIARTMALIDGAIVASGHAAFLSKAIERAETNGPITIGQTLFFDDELGGESRESFMELWNGARPQPRTQAVGVTFKTCDVRLTTEQDEPLLLLPDYVAGLNHCVQLAGSETDKFPLTGSEANECLAPMRNGKFKFGKATFDLDYRSMFGDAIAAAETEMRRRYPNG